MAANAVSWRGKAIGQVIFLQDLKQKNMPRRILVMLLGIVVLGIGVGMFKLALLGNDPSTALVIAIGDRIGVDFSLVLIVMNLLWFLVELFFDRRLIGVGTFVNWFCVGPIASFFERTARGLLGAPDTLTEKLGIMLPAILVLSFACSLYQTADVGIAPYDALSIVLSKKVKPAYFWCRIFTDSLCVVIAWALGGLIGLGTLVCALGLGPFIAFFTRHAAQKLVGVTPRGSNP